MEVIYQPLALKDIEYWKKSGNKRIQTKIIELIDNIIKTPFEGIGKPEQLKHNLAGMWSRRINKEHIIVYTVENNTVHIFSLKGHY